ncbi:MAG TPA: hypothetical protein VGQ69_12955 [Gemmatimonadales bacterium]|jgi:hypothetical protein|nr:hypothetical protein [Gemmatimonadales bacterium]
MLLYVGGHAAHQLGRARPARHRNDDSGSRLAPAPKVYCQRKILTARNDTTSHAATIPKLGGDLRKGGALQHAGAERNIHRGQREGCTTG